MDISKLRFVQQLFINGRFVNSIRGNTLKVINPHDESILASVQKAGTEDVDAAVSLMREFKDDEPNDIFSRWERYYLNVGGTLTPQQRVQEQKSLMYSYRKRNTTTNFQ